MVSTGAYIWRSTIDHEFSSLVRFVFCKVTDDPQRTPGVDLGLSASGPVVGPTRPRNHALCKEAESQYHKNIDNNLELLST